MNSNEIGTVPGMITKKAEISGQIIFLKKILEKERNIRKEFLNCETKTDYRGYSITLLLNHCYKSLDGVQKLVEKDNLQQAELWLMNVETIMWMMGKISFDEFLNKRPREMC